MTMRNRKHPIQDQEATSVTLCLRRKEVARRLQVSVRSVERWALKGGGPPFVVAGGARLYPVKHLEEWVAKNLHSSTAAVTVARAGRRP